MTFPISVSARFAEGLTHLFPNAHPLSWIVEDHGDGTGPHLARWELEAPVPTEAEVSAALAAKDAAEPARLRKLAYIAESDGVAIRAQRLEWLNDPDAAAARQEYLDKVAEIKARFPDVVSE